MGRLHYSKVTDRQTDKRGLLLISPLEAGNGRKRGGEGGRQERMAILCGRPCGEQERKWPVGVNQLILSSTQLYSITRNTAFTSCSNSRQA